MMVALAHRQRSTKAGSTNPIPEAPLSTIGCTAIGDEFSPARTLPCNLSNDDNSVRAPLSCSGGGGGSISVLIFASDDSALLPLQDE